jgi:tetratricopeptide (TPR) repeat protein
MSETKRTFADWIWSLVGIAGVIFIIVAILMLVIPRFSSDPAKEDPAGTAHELWEGAKEKLAAGDTEGAVRDLNQAVALVEGRHPVYLNDLGEALAVAGMGDKAAPNFLAAIGVRPFYARPYLNLGRWRDTRGEHGAALARYRAALALHPEPVPQDLANRVAELMGEFRVRREEELAKVRKSLRANPADFQSFSILVLSELMIIRVEADAKPAAGLAAALSSIGEDLGNLDELLARQESGVADRPDSVVDLAGLGVVLLVRGDKERALKTFGKALELSGNDRVSNLGAVLAAVLAGKPGDERIEKVARAFRVNPVAWLCYGAALLEQEDKLLESRKALLAALQLNPSVPETYRLLALTFTTEEEAKDREAALRGYERLGEE